MSPLAVLTAIVFGSATAISFGLTATLIVFLVLRGERPQLAHELPSLLRSCLWFVGLAAVSGVALYAALKRERWRGWAQLVLWSAVTLVGFVFWPR
ncbi:MAG: hypothetical protein H7Y02_10105 [Candidatus Obscuribacterales bacterium]|nr:hypothetical protein [Steroidobacteraceae bacterium]